MSSSADPRQEQHAGQEEQEQEQHAGQEKVILLLPAAAAPVYPAPASRSWLLSFRNGFAVHAFTAIVSQRAGPSEVN